MTPKLSIIIPVYNGQNYIVRCLDSAYALPLLEEELEVIVVDDCSTDNTLQVLYQYAEKHANMIVLHQDTNQRQGAARNRGIDLATGEYISFVDADDWIVEEGYMNALNAVAKSHVDICYFELEFKNANSHWTICEMPLETRNTIMSSAEYLNKYYTCYYNGPVRNLYRTVFLHSTGVRFVEGVRWEDCDWTVKVYAQAKDIQFVDGVGYRYEQNETNTCSISATPVGYAEQIYAGTRLLNFSDNISNELPGLANTIKKEAIGHYIHGILRLRNFSKFPPSFIQIMLQMLPDSTAKLLLRTDIPTWDRIICNNHILAVIISYLFYPIATIGRYWANLIRKLK